ncbi:MAG: MBL fold metallo-hydrolase [Pseudomonadota bacterium]|nr:MBL fold metallo-hydrolase [Pseudomonadota bacterium]
MRFASLGSGSGGNALVCCAGGTTLLLDCGFGLAETQLRMGRLGLTMDALNAIVVTHEHSDHVQGVARLARRYSLKVWLTYGTWRMMEERMSGIDVEFIEADISFSIGDLLLYPYTVPHDAREPVQFVLSDGKSRLGVLTDAGRRTPHIESMLTGMDGLVLECNHDRQMLEKSNYPPSLKRRIGGPYGHMDNEEAAQLLAALDTSHLKHLIAAHLSEQNNNPELVRRKLAAVMGCKENWVGVASQVEGFRWREF